MAYYTIKAQRTVATTNGMIFSACAVNTVILRRFKLHALKLSFTAPGDAQVTCQLQRITGGHGTGTAYTPQKRDPADGVAAFTAAVAHTVDATVTANEIVDIFNLNQRALAPLIWSPAEKVVVPATHNNGIALWTPALSGTAPVVDCVAVIEEL